VQEMRKHKSMAVVESSSPTLVHKGGA
jgi:hypothetical protein